MIGFGARRVFTEHEVDLLARAKLLVEFAPDEVDGELVRCHELARAVGRVMGLSHCDGRFGFVEHTWLWTSKFEAGVAPWVLPRILDVYVPGAVPQVQLIDTSSGLPARYYLSNVFDVAIRQEVVEDLVTCFRGVKWGLR